MTIQNRPEGAHLKDWRQRRRLSHLDLACEARISTRHLSFVETGRSAPSREMLPHLAEPLRIPMRERNVLLIAAGFAPIFPEGSLADPQLGAARRAVDLVLEAQKPYPAFAIDRHWNVLASNAALPELYDGVAEELLRPLINALRLCLYPAGLAPRTANLPEWREHLISRLHHEVELKADPTHTELLSEASAYEMSDGMGTASVSPPSRAILTPFQILTEAGLLSFFATTAVFGTPVDVTLSELAIESFFPADAATVETVRCPTEIRISSP